MNSCENCSHKCVCEHRNRLHDIVDEVLDHETNDSSLKNQKLKRQFGELLPGLCEHYEEKDRDE